MPANTPIDLAIAVFNERIEIQIWDWGKPLNFPGQLKIDQSQAKDTFGLKELEFMF